MRRALIVLCNFLDFVLPVSGSLTGWITAVNAARLVDIGTRRCNQCILFKREYIYIYSDLIF